MLDLPFLILLLLLVAVLLRVDFIFYIVYVCLGVYAWAYWYTPYALRNLTSRRRYRDHAFLGEAVPVAITIVNRSRLPVPWLQLHESVPIALQVSEPLRDVVTLRGRAEVTLGYELRAFRRGYYRLGPTSLYLGDLFGFRDLVTRSPTDYLTVYPRILPLTRLGLPSRLPFGTVRSRQRLFEDPARPFGVRAFQSGDSLRHVNWKVSARQGATSGAGPLQVKTFEPAISLETAVLLNLNSDDYQHDRYRGPEWAIEVAAALAAHLVDQRQGIGLLTNGLDPLRAAGAEPRFDETSGRLLSGNGQRAAAPIGAAAQAQPIPPRGGRAHLMKVLEVLARVEAVETSPFTAWAPRVCLALSWGVTVLAISPRADDAVCQMLHRLGRAGLNPLLVVIAPDAHFGRVRERARRLGFSAYHVLEPPDLEELTGEERRP